MADLAALAQPAVSELLQCDESELFVQLGNRVRAMTVNPQLGGEFAPTIGEPMGPVDDLRNWGERFFMQINVQAYGLACGTGAADNKDRQDLIDAFSGGIDKVAAALAALLVAQFAIAPAVAAVVAAIVVKRFFRAGYNATCDYWKANLPQAGG
jgi:hypothetical protein